jgi:hypothetical protein
MKAVEVQVRKLADVGEDINGVDVMNRAFGPTRPLTETSAARRFEVARDRAALPGSATCPLPRRNHRC